MQNILFIVNAPPYGSERVLSALRLATQLAAEEFPPVLRVFLLSDAVGCALSGQQAAAGVPLGQMLAELIDAGVKVYACRTCLDARGLSADRLLAGVEVGTMPILARLTLDADKVLSF
ncbi:DsrE/DsrF/TusD sulfur relay family protein [Crenobacter intestini]|uniref:Uncharacterized protein n=1 Tax=Crenobacter intestini TaxID=2563443 RepID=A0A4T0UXC9_9NEIS|nr:DsrE family protein [Crenobacter intestini]TIC83416.1 hypothetical protein E5K04_07605 [Crenobacter intestini]